MPLLVTLEIILVISLSKSGYLVVSGDRDTLLIAFLKLELVLFWLLFDVVLSGLLLVSFVSCLSPSLFLFSSIFSTTWTIKLTVDRLLFVSGRV